MSAEVETMAFHGELPWHGLGVEVGDDLTPDQIMTIAGCDWGVSKRPMFYPGEAATRTLPVHDHYALVRDSDHSLLDVVGSRYQPTQNRDAFEFFDQFVKECKLKMHTAGSLCKGQYVWALAKTENEYKVAANDSLESYVLLMSPHKLGKSLICQNTSVRVVCQNTLNLALSQGKAAFRMSHARRFDETAKAEAATVLGLINASFRQFGEQAEQLASVKASDDDARQFFGAVFNMDDATIDSEKQRKNSLLQRLMLAYSGEAPGAMLSSARGTYWGLVNSVTWCLDRSLTGNPDKNLRDNWLGWRGTKKREALELAVKMAA